MEVYNQFVSGWVKEVQASSIMNKITGGKEGVIQHKSNLNLHSDP